MAASLFQHGAIRTTEAKAKELRRFVEKLITQAKKNTLHARRMVISSLGHDRAMFGVDEERQDKTVVQKLFDEIAPAYADRPGGFTRIVRLAERRIGDAGQQVILQLVEEGKGSTGATTTSTSRRRRRATKRHAAADAVVVETPAQAPAEAEEVVDEAPAEGEDAPEEK